MSKSLTITEPGEPMFFNWDDDGAVEHTAFAIHRCREIECLGNSLFLSYPAGPSTVERAKADLDVIMAYIDGDAPIGLVLAEKDDELWLCVCFPEPSTFGDFEKSRQQRFIHHLSETVLKRP